MRIPGMIIGLALGTGLGLIQITNAADAQPGALTAEQARAEVEQIYTRIATEHPDPFWFFPEETWQARRDALLARPGPIAPERQYFDLTGLLSLAMDTHVQTYPEADTPGFETSYPLRVRLLDDGIYITAADAPYRDWVGGKILSLAGLAPEAVLDQLDDYAFSDNPRRRRSWAVEQWLIQPAAYRYFGWQNHDGSVNIELEMPDGTRRSVQLSQTVDTSFDAVLRSGRSQAYYWPEGWRTLDDLSASPVPISRQHLDQPFWYTELDDGAVLYVQFNTSMSTPGEEDFVAFTLDLFQTVQARETPPSRLIIDVRYNLGGWINRSLPMAFLAQTLDACCEPGSVILLIGQETISAGSVFAGVTEIATRAVTIGQPTGGRPNIVIGQQGENLPWSNLYVEVSREPYLATDSSDDRLFIAPDIPVPETLADLIAGRDAALERALGIEAEALQAVYTPAARLRPWTRPSQAVARHTASPPRP